MGLLSCVNTLAGEIMIIAVQKSALCGGTLPRVKREAITCESPACRFEPKAVLKSTLAALARYLDVTDEHSSERDLLSQLLIGVQPRDMKIC